MQPYPTERSTRALGAAVAMGLIFVVGSIYTVAAAGDVVGPLLSTVVAVFPALVVVGLVLLFDRYEPEPRGMLALTFAFGATGAILIAMIFNELGRAVATMALGPEGGTFVGTAMVAPFVEELAKGAAVLVVMVRLKDRFNGIVDGIVYAVMVAVGFAFAENVTYFMMGLYQGGMSGFTSTVVMRGIMAPFAHPLFTSMTGIGLALSREIPKTRYWAPVAGLLAAMTLHGIWNASTFIGIGYFVVYALLFLPLLAVAIGITWWAAKTESKVIGSYLAMDVQAGLLTADEVAEMTSLKRRREVLKYAAQQGGSTAVKARRAFHHAAAQLAFARHRSRPNAPDPAVEMNWVREIARYKKWVDPNWVAPAGISEA